MITCSKISDLEYYIDEAAKAAAEGREPIKNDVLTYHGGHHDNDITEAKGQWWRRNDGRLATETMVERGTEVVTADFRAMGAGHHPKTGEQMIASNRKERMCGYDVTFSPPKSVSVAWFVGDDDRRAAIEKAHHEAVTAALDFIDKEGLIEARWGKNGVERGRPQDYAAATWFHTIARPDEHDGEHGLFGDMQIHTHAVFMNVCVRPDGSTGTLDNQKLLDYQHAVGAIYDAHLAAAMRNLGFATERDRLSYKIAGIPEHVVEFFSKRRNRIVKVAAEHGFETADNRERANLVAQDTRGGKEGMADRAEHFEQWEQELKGLGWTRDSVVRSAEAARREHDRKAQAEAAERAEEMELVAEFGTPGDAATLERERLERIDVLAKAGIDEAMLTTAVLDRRQAMAAVIRAVQCEYDDQEGEAAFHRIVESGFVRQVGTNETKDDDPVYTTPEFERIERQMRLDAKERRNERVFVAPEAVEKAVKGRQGLLTDDQGDAVLWTLVSGEADETRFNAGAVRQAMEAAKLDTAQAAAVRKIANEYVAKTQGKKPEDAEVIKAAKDARKALARLKGISDEQAEAVRHALNNDGVSVVEGSAGSGKSFSLGAVTEAAREVGLNVHVLAPSWRATEVAREDTDTAAEMAVALQGFVARLDPSHKKHIVLGPDDIIVIDEAGLCGTRDIAAVLAAARKAGAKVVLSGDTKQINPVSAGAPMRLVAQDCGTQRISEIRRQELEWQRRATADFPEGRADRALDAYDDHSRVVWGETRDAAMNALLEDWSQHVAEHPDKTRIVMSTTNRDVAALNRILRARARELGLIKGDEVLVPAQNRAGEKDGLVIADGDRIIFAEQIQDARNKPPAWKLRNGTIATVESIVATDDEKDPIVTVRLDDGTIIRARWSEFRGFRKNGDTRPPLVQPAYAISVNAAQGLTVDQGFAYNGAGMGMRNLYVAMSRQREDVKLYIDTSRIVDRLEARRGRAMTIYRAGNADAPDEGEKRTKTKDEEPITLAQIKAEIRKEALRDDNKANVCDYTGNPREFARGDASATSPEVPLVEELKAKADKQPKPSVYERLLAFGRRIVFPNFGAAEVQPAAKEVNHERSPVVPAPRLGAVGTEPPPAARNHLRHMSEQHVAPRGSRSSVLLPCDVSVGVDDRAAGERHGVRRPDHRPGGGGRMMADDQTTRRPGGFRPGFGVKLPKQEGVGEGADKTVQPTAAAARPFGGFRARFPSAEAQETAREMQERRTNPYPVQRPSNRYVTKDEKDFFVRQDLRALMVEHGYQQVEAYQPRNGRQGYILRDPNMGDGGKVSVIEGNNGVWTWASRDGGETGKVAWDFLTSRTGRTYADALRYLRDRYRTTPDSVPPAPSYSSSQPARVEQYKQAMVAPKSKEYDFDGVRRRWAMMQSGEGNEYLIKVRGIHPAVIKRFASDIRTEGPQSKQNPYGACFSHRDEDWAIDGYERKGPKQPGEKRSFSQWSKGGRKSITRMGERENPTDIYVGESAIDLLSIYQYDGQPDRPLLCSLYGGADKAAYDQIAKLAEKHPNARIHLCFDNDKARQIVNSRTGEVTEIKAGDQFEKNTRAAILARVADAESRIINRHPPEAFKDWNDVVRGIRIDPQAEQRQTPTVTRPQAPAATVTQQQPSAEAVRRKAEEDRKAAEMAEAMRRQREAEERRRREEAARRGGPRR